MTHQQQGLLAAQELQVLSAIHRLGYVSAQELAKDSGLKPHAVRQSLHNLFERRAIEPFCSINVIALGLQPYMTYFSFSSATPEEEELALRVALDHPNVNWLARIGHHYDFGISVLAESVDEALRIYGELRQGMGLEWAGKSFIQASSMFLWPLKCFGFEGDPGVTIVLRQLEGRYAMDDLDHRILAFKAANPLSPDASVARFLSIPEATASYRLKRLHNAGVINGYGVSPVWESLGLLQHKVAISFKTLDLELHEALVGFAHRTMTCVGAIPCLGAWDFEFNIFTSQGDNGRSFMAMIEAEFGGVIEHVRVLPYSRALKLNPYPFAVPPCELPAARVPRPASLA